jgi:N-acetylneuraminate synthase/N,N'-diacetyllegionaminate synthase
MAWTGQDVDGLVNMKSIEIDGRRVGAGEPTFVIAEIGVNHNGNMEMARQLVDLAVDTGADAVKFQTFKAEKLASSAASLAPYQKRAGEAAGSQVALLRPLELNEASHVELKSQCLARGVAFLSTPFDEESADMLDRLSVPAFKVSSGDLTNLPFLRHLARKAKPLIVSTGMANLAEVEGAVDAMESSGLSSFALLHCVSSYPASASDANLRAISVLRDAFQCPVGWSDHTVTHAVSWAAVALGASIIEKHITLDRSLPGPDHAASTGPEEFREFVTGIRTIESALGSGRKHMRLAERQVADIARRSLVALVDIPEGVTIADSHIGQRRPGTGLSPALRHLVVGKRARRSISAGSLISLGSME